MATTEKKREWTDKQKECIYYHDGTLLVSAAAGSGKTSVLVQRIIERITAPQNRVDINRLLVATFTRAAATEMKSRLATELAKLIRENPNDTNLQRQQLLLPRAVIGTIDSFCGELVRQNFHLLSIPPQFRTAEEEQLALIKKEALIETVDEFYEAADPAFFELLAGLAPEDGSEALMALIEKIHGFLQSHPDPDAWLDKMSAAYDPTASVRNTVWGQYTLHGIATALEKAARVCRSAIMLCNDNAALAENYRPQIVDDLSFIERAREACDMASWDDLLRTLQSFSPGDLTSIRKPDDPALVTRVKALRDLEKAIIRSLPATMCGDEHTCLDDIAQTAQSATMLYAMVRRFSVLFMEKKREQQMFGFSDISHMALELLTEKDAAGNRTPSALATELSQQYDEILVDEYQDTNELQGAVFSAISRGESNMFFVGDVKQSIYGFRHAEPAMFLKRRDQYPLFDKKHYPGTILLGNNFRSRREVTNAVNFMFRQLMTKEFGGLSYDKGEELVPTASYEEREGFEPELLLAETKATDGTKFSANEAEAEILATRISELVGSLEIGAKDGGTRKLRYGDCCILVRSRTANGAYRNALERHGIPVVTDDAGEFFNTAEIRLALSLLRCIDNPLLDVSLTAWLASPLCGFSPDDLALIRGCRKHTAFYNALTAARREAPTDDLRARCTAAVAFLERYRTLACQVTVDRLLRRLYEETALPELMSAREDGERRRINLQLLQEACAKFDQKGFRGLSAFVRHIDRLQEQGIGLPGAATVDTGGSVRVMTIHGSKGLEFPVVFAAGLHHAFSIKNSRETLLLHPEFGAGMKRRDPLTLARYVTLPHNALNTALGDAEREEELRLLYVAMTRAREKLCLTASVANPIKKIAALAAELEDTPTIAEYSVRSAKSMLDWVLTAMIRHPSAADWRREIDREDLLPLADDIPWTLRICKPTLTEEIEEEAPERAVADDELVADIRHKIAYRYPHEALAKIPAKLAASSTAHGDLERRYVAQTVPSFLQGERLSPAERGTAMHAFMQYAVYADAKRDIEREITRLYESGKLTEAQAKVLDKRALKAFFDDAVYERMARSPRCLREYQFTALQSAAQVDASVSDTEYVVIQGMADCVFEENGALVILDYKTDRVSTAEELAERYHSQLAAYREALEQTLGMPVSECLLYSFALGQTVTIS